MKPEYIFPVVPNPDTIFTDLLINLKWLEVTEARKEYFMSDIPRSYTYGKGENARTYDSNQYVLSVQHIQDFLNYASPANYNICFINRYDTYKNQLGWHADDSPQMDFSHPIAVVSLGAEREIWWKPKDHKGEIPLEWRQKLEHGSLFVMPAGFQEKFYHRIPKSDRAVGPRISLTFRRYK